MAINTETAQIVDSLSDTDANVQTNTDDIALLGPANIPVPTNGDINKTLKVNAAETGYDLVRPKIGALVMHSVDQSITGTTLFFDSEVYDDAAIHDNTTNNTRLTVPAGYTKARIYAQVVYTNNTATRHSAYFRKNGLSDFIGNVVIVDPLSTGGSSENTLNVKTAFIPVTAGDYFELNAGLAAGSATALSDSTSLFGGTWFACEFTE